MDMKKKWGLIKMEYKVNKEIKFLGTFMEPRNFKDKSQGYFAKDKCKRLFLEGELDDINCIGICIECNCMSSDGYCVIDGEYKMNKDVWDGTRNEEK
jgi:hypothetical protein